MGRNRSNKFKSAVRHLKTNQIDEKLELLSEIPTNNIGNLYSIEPEFNVQDPDIPGEVTREVDFTQDDSASDTTGLFDDDGTILTIEPPITADSPDRSYILGPMSSMWYSWGNFTQIGYIRESDRRMVNLGRIVGQLKDWDGVNNFTSYGQLTLEQAKWFRDTPKYLDGYDNYRAFYPGPPSNTPDQYGRYRCTITGTTKPTTLTPPIRRVPPVQGGPNAAGYPSWGNNPTSPRPRTPVPPPEPGAPIDPIGDLVILGISFVLAKSLTAALKLGVTYGATRLAPKVVNALKNLKPKPKPTYGPPKAKYPTTPKSKFKIEPQPPANRPPSYSRGRGMGDRWEGPLSNSYQPNGELIAEGLEELPVELIPIIHNVLVDMGGYTSENIDKLIKVIEKHSKPIKESREVISESRKRILRDIKKPYVLPEVKQEKYKFKKLDKVRAKHGRTINSDLMKQAEVPSSFKAPDDRLWGKYEKEKNARNSQDKKNVVLDHLGGGDHFLEYVYENGKQKNQISYEMFGGKAPKKVVRKEQLKGDNLLFIADENGKKESILQSEINDKLDQEFNKELFEKYFEEQKTPQKTSLIRVNSKGFKDFHQKRLDEKNFIADQRLQEEKKILEEKKWQEEVNEIAKKHKSNWRKELLDNFEELEPAEVSEGMTTSGMFQTTLEPSDDIIFSPDVSTASNLEGATLYDGAIYLNHVGATNTRTATINNVDLTQVDYMIFRRTYIPSASEVDIPWAQITQINGQYVNWGAIPISQIPGGPSIDDGYFYTYLTPDQQIKNASLKFFQSIADYAAADPDYGGWYISQISFYRTRPMNVFVSLDSPEATAFIRTDPVMQGLSPNQRYKKLLEMLDAGDEYLLKALGMQGSKARPAETQMPQSWEQAASQPSYMNIQVGDQQYVSQDGQVQTDTTRGIKNGKMDGNDIYYDDQGNMRVSQPQPEYNPTVYNPEIDGGYTHLDYLYGGPEERARIKNIWNQRNKNASSSTTTSTAPPAQNYQKPTPMFDKYGRRTDTGEKVRGMKTTDPVGDLATLGAAAALTKGGLALAKTGAVGQTIRQVGKAFKPKPTGPVKAKYPTSAKPKPKPSSKYRIDEPLNPTGTSRPPSYSRGRGMGDRWEGPLRNSYEPSGELISEKKRLKSPKEVIANKIPGYYDGKPAPLGFPMEPPAKIINGFHADLVTSDGQKKQSNRYNALDPASAKAMPPTGNPHIDKKVKAAAKKSK